MVIAGSQVEDKLGRAQFFQKSFLSPKTNMKMVLQISFLILSNLDIHFAEKKLTWRFYTATEALPITKQVELINKKEFAKALLGEESKTFVLHVAALDALLAGMAIYLLQKGQISGLI